MEFPDLTVSPPKKAIEQIMKKINNNGNNKFHSNQVTANPNMNK